MNVRSCNKLSKYKPTTPYSKFCRIIPSLTMSNRNNRLLADSIHVIILSAIFFLRLTVQIADFLWFGLVAELVRAHLGPTTPEIFTSDIYPMDSKGFINNGFSHIQFPSGKQIYSISMIG